MNTHCNSHANDSYGTVIQAERIEHTTCKDWLACLSVVNEEALLGVTPLHLDLYLGSAHFNTQPDYVSSGSVLEVRVRMAYLRTLPDRSYLCFRTTPTRLLNLPGATSTQKPRLGDTVSMLPLPRFYQTWVRGKLLWAGSQKVFCGFSFQVRWIKEWFCCGFHKELNCT